MSRLSAIGHDLYERALHRHARPDKAERSAPPTRQSPTVPPINDQEPSSASVMDEIAQDLAAVDVDEAAYGEDAGRGTSASSETDGESDSSVKDSGDLYGVHTGYASDRSQLDDDQAFDRGQNWIESLETSAAEGGPEPEHEVIILDEEDLSSPPADSKDRPIADLGSGGPRGL